MLMKFAMELPIVRTHPMNERNSASRPFVGRINLSVTTVRVWIAPSFVTSRKTALTTQTNLIAVDQLKAASK